MFNVEHLPRFRRGFVFFAFLIAIAPFLLGLPGGFLFDDYPTIVQSDLVRLTSLSAEGLWQAAFAFHPEGGLPRPLVNASFALNHWASGLDPAPYKIANIAIHLLNGWLVYRLTKALLAHLEHPQRIAMPLAVLVAAIWIVHPLQVSTVLYVVQRMEMVCTTFTLVAVLSYAVMRIRMINGHRGVGGLAAASIVSACLAWTAKENAALIPYFLLATEALIFRAKAASHRAASLLRAGVKAGVFIGAAAALWLYVAGVLNESAFASRDFSPIERLAAQAVIVPFYLGLILVPRVDAMVFYYDHLWLREWGQAEVFGGLLFLTAMVGVAFVYRRRNPLVAFGIAWFFIAHLITSAPIPLELAFEHRNYTALFGVVLAIIGAVAPAVRSTDRRLIAVPVVLIAVLAGMTSLRAAYWNDPSLLAHYLADINPQSARAAIDLGERHMLAANKQAASPHTAKAIAEFERAMAMPHGSILGEHAAILMAAQFGIEQRQSWWDSMVRKLQNDPLRPQDVDALVGVVEHRLNGFDVNDQNLVLATLAAARRDKLSAGVLLLFATHAKAVPSAEDAALELFARGRKQARNDPDYVNRIDRGILATGGGALLQRVKEAEDRL